MSNRISLLILLLVSTTPFLYGQDCKLRFSVAYTNGKNIHVGLTSDQRKMWSHAAAEEFKGLCLDDNAASFIILWGQGPESPELSKMAIDQCNAIRLTPKPNANVKTPDTTSSATPSGYESSPPRGRANYFILDASRQPCSLVHRGDGYQPVPIHTGTVIDYHPVDVSDPALTTPDPVEALFNALKWLKKEKKL